MTVTEVPSTVDWHGQKVPVYPMETVDFGRLLSQEPEELQHLLKCCQQDGFFYLDLNNLDGKRYLEDQQDTLGLMHRFFEQPLEVKNEFGLVSAHLGYEPVGCRTGAFPNRRDGYEMLKVSRDEIQHPSGKVPGVLGRNPAELRVLEHAIGGANTVTKAILAGLSTAMGRVGADRFEAHHRNSQPSTSTLAMMHYIPSDPLMETVGHQKHTDISSLTLLFSEQWGLQIRPPGTRQFGFVAPRPGTAVVNVGDSLRFASGHTMMSCIHRVVPFDATEHRHSIAYFLRAENDSMFVDSEGRYITAGQWHDEKFFVFKSAPEIQAAAPPSMLYGGMRVDDDETPLPAAALVPLLPPTAQSAPPAQAAHVEAVTAH